MFLFFDRKEILIKLKFFLIKQTINLFYQEVRNGKMKKYIKNFFLILNLFFFEN